MRATAWNGKITQGELSATPAAACFDFDKNTLHTTPSDLLLEETSVQNQKQLPSWKL